MSGGSGPSFDPRGVIRVEASSVEPEAGTEGDPLGLLLLGQRPIGGGDLAGAIEVDHQQGARHGDRVADELDVGGVNRAIAVDVAEYTVEELGRGELTAAVR